MKKKSLLLLASSILCSGLTGCKPTEDPNSKGIKILDMIGREVYVPKEINKVICVGACSLRMYSMVGDLKKLNGIEKNEKYNLEKHDPKKEGTYINKPYSYVNYLKHPELQKLPTIGDGGSKAKPQDELILNNIPDVIFWRSSEKAVDVDKYEKKCGCPIIVLDNGDTEFFGEKLEQSLKLIGKVMNTSDKAERIISYMNSMEKEIKSSVDAYRKLNNITDDKDPKVYIGGINYKGGRSIFSTHPNYPVFKMANVKNWCDGIVDPKAKTQVDVSPEHFFGESGPDRIIIDAAGLNSTKNEYLKDDAIAKNLEQLTAVKNGDVYVQLPYRFYATNIGNAWCNSYSIANATYPGCFGEKFNIDNKANEIFKTLYGEAVYSNSSLSNDIKRGCYGGFQKVPNLKEWLITDAYKKINK